jgi:hypothetical protein
MAERQHQKKPKIVYVLWVLQVLLAALFVFAGVAKLVMPLEEMQKGPVVLPGALLRFVGFAEVLGAFGLILPGVFRVRQGLTPLAASGLVIIMIGATVINLESVGVGFAVFTLVVGLLAAFVAYSRWRLLPGRRIQASRVADTASDAISIES